VFLSLSKALMVSSCGCVFMMTMVSFPVPSLLWLYVMLVASFLSVIERSVPDVAVTGESFILNWKNHCPIRSVAGSADVKFRSQYLVSSMQFSHVMLVWLKHVFSSHLVGGFGVPLSMNRLMFSMMSGSPLDAVTEKFQFGVPQPAVVKLLVGFSSFLTAVRKNSPGSVRFMFVVWLL